MLLSAGCEPASITEARNKLQGDAPDRDVSFTVPILRDTFTVRELLDSAAIANGTIDTATLSSGVFAVSLNPRQIGVEVGSRLQFDNVALTRFSLNVPTGTGPGSFPISQSYQGLQSEPRLQAVDSVLVKSGSLTFTTFNKLPGVLVDTITLNGFRDAQNNVLRRVDTVAAAPGNGTQTSHSVTFTLANVKIKTAAVTIALVGSVNLTSQTASATQDSSVIQSTSGTLVVQRLWGPLDPAKTPELTVATEDSVEIPASDVPLGDFSDALRDARLNDARIQLTISNTADAPLVLSNFTLGVVQLTASGQVPRNGSGNPVYQTDSLGAITVPVADSGKSTLTVGRGATKSVTLQAARLADRILDLLLAQPSLRAGVIGKGTATVGDGALSTITATDLVNLNVGVTVALDFSIPPAGLKVDTVFVQDGRALIPADSAAMAQRVLSAIASAAVTNGTPFAVEVVGALLPGSLPGISVDSALRRTDRVSLDTVRVNAAPVDAQGRVTQPQVTVDSTSLTGAGVSVVFGARFTVAIRVRLLPGTGTRGALRSSDAVILRSSGTVQVRTGGR